MFAIAIHGGSEVINRQDLTPDLEKSYLESLQRAINSGYAILRDQGNAVNAVEAAVISMENNPLFNAGKGAAFTSDGIHEMEAAIMDGKSLRAGAVSGLNRVKNPIKLARMIMEKSEYLFLHGGGAEKFALENSLSFESDEYFFTDKSYQQLQKAKLVKVNAKGTVGAVAIDSQGNLASATSTGGTSNKSYGRIGDSPIIGAGTYANTICAVSCTGEGEYFIRAVAAHLINSLLEFHNFSLHQACEFLILNKIKHMGGEGGVIAIDKEGNLEMIFNSEGMYRGYRIQNQEPRTFIY